MKFTTYIFSIALLSICNVVQAQIRVACMAGDTIELNIAQARGTVQWQASADSLVWTDILGANSEQIDYHPSAGIQWVRAAISESDCPPFYEHPVRVSAVDTTAADFDPLIIVMDTVTVQFLPDSAQQSAGQYDFEVIGSNVNIDPGDILIGTEGRGYLVSVDYMIRSNNQLIIQTHRANLDDLFDDASFDLEMLMDSLEQRDFGVQLAINNLEIVSDGNLSFTFPALNYQLTGASQWASLYSVSQGMQQFSVQHTYGLTLGGEMSISNASPGVSSDLTGSYSLAVYDNTSEVDVDGKPLMYTTQVDLIIDYNLVQWGTSCDLSTSFSNYADIGYDLSYTPSSFYDLFSYNGAPGADFSLFSNEDGCNLAPNYAHYEITFLTKVTSYFYDQPFLFLEIAEDVDVKYDQWFGQWDKTIEALPVLNDTLDLFVLGIFDDLNTSLQQPLPFDYEYKAPYELSLVSGALQSAMADSALAEPVIVQVLDNQGEPVKDARVWVEVSGGGTITAESLLTDAEGKFYVNWTLGNNAFDFQMLSIFVMLHDDSHIQGSPLEVYAILSTACGGLTTITDLDGNEYPVIAIGNQCWTQTNLRTTHFSDQTEIPNVTDNLAWVNLTSPAWSYFENNELNNSIYGKLYNGWAVHDSLNLCPVGWHVPTLQDWGVLINTVGGWQTAGGALKTTTGWTSPNEGATNMSGFSALPGGHRHNVNGTFIGLGGLARFWGQGQAVVDQFGLPAVYGPTDELSLYYFHSQAIPSTETNINGLSVRCVKDN